MMTSDKMKKFDTFNNVLVTGGGGFLGSAIIKMLSQNGTKAVSFSRRHYPALEQLGVKQIQGNISDLAAVQKAAKGMDLVFHAAAKPGIWGKYQDYYKTNVTGTKNVIQACKEQDVESLVYTSSPSVVFNGLDMEGVDESVNYPEKYHAHYPETKAIAEKLVIAAGKNGQKTVILRPHLIWGPEDNHLVPKIINRANKLARITRPHKSGSTSKFLVDTIYIDNAAYAHLLAADKLKTNPEISGKIYFISQADPVPVWEMINNILKAGGKPPVTKSISKTKAKIAGTVFEFIFKTFGIQKDPPLTRFVVDELSTAHWFDISAAKTDLGYEPIISISEGLDILEKWLKNKKETPK